MIDRLLKDSRLSAWAAPLKWGCVAALLAALYSLSLPNQYRSEARILPADQRSSGGLGAAASAAAAAVGIAIPGQESADAAYVDILKSRSLREALLQTPFTFQVRTWYFGTPETRTQTLYQYLGKKNVTRALSALNERISINRDFKTKLLTISTETESPELSRQVTQCLVKLLDEFVVSKARTKGGAKAEFAEKRLDEARTEMAEAENALRLFLDANRNYLQSPDPAVRLKGQRLEGELKLRSQVVTTLTLAREQALLEEKNDMPILNILDPGDLPEDKSRPSRSGLVLMAFLLGAAAAWARAHSGQLLQALKGAGLSA